MTAWSLNKVVNGGVALKGVTQMSLNKEILLMVKGITGSLALSGGSDA